MLNLFKQIRPYFLKIKFNTFARFNRTDDVKVSDVEIMPNEKVKTKKIKSQAKTIEIQETFKIKPYFSQAVSAKEKSSANVSVSGLIEDPKGGKSTERKEEMKKKKLDQRKNVALENIKRQLPHELYLFF
jgi:hypothetical protein